MPLSAPGKFKTAPTGNTYGGEGTGEDFLATAANNTLVGANAGGEITSGIENTVVGSTSLPLATTWKYTTVIGYGNLGALTTYTPTPSASDPYPSNVILGAHNAPLWQTGPAIIVGNNNLPLMSSGGSNFNSVIIGFNIGADGGGNVGMYGTANLPDVAIGTNQLRNAPLVGGITAPNFTWDILIGANAGGYYQGHTSAAEPNVVIGKNALLCQNFGTRTPYGSVAIGYNAMAGATLAYRDVAIGNESCANITTGYANVTIGYRTARLVSTGYQNVIIGSSASDSGALTGYDNVVMGHAAATTLSSGYRNVIIGSRAGDSITIGFQNTLVGENAGSTLTTGENNILIGYNVQASAVGATQEVAVGDLFTGSMLAADRQTNLNGALKLRRTAYAANSAGGDETIIGCTASNITITLTTAMIARAGRTWIIKDESGTAAGGSPITIATEGAETIDGAATATITTAYGALRIYSNGTNLFLI